MSLEPGEVSVADAKRLPVALQKPACRSPQHPLVVGLQKLAHEIEVEGREPGGRLNQLLEAAGEARAPESVEQGPLGTGRMKGRAAVANLADACECCAPAGERRRMRRELDAYGPHRHRSPAPAGEHAEKMGYRVRGPEQFEGAVVPEYASVAGGGGEQEGIGDKAIGVHARWNRGV